MPTFQCTTAVATSFRCLQALRYAAHVILCNPPAHSIAIKPYSYMVRLIDMMDMVILLATSGWFVVQLGVYYIC